MAEIKTKPQKGGVKKFLASVEHEERRKDALALLPIFEAITKEKPVLWGNSMIGFGQYHYESTRSSQKGDWPLTAFSPRKANLTIYIMPGFKEYGDLLKKLGPHKTGGSCLYIKRLSDIHVPTLKSLIRNSVKEMKKRYRS
jgi:hypothetical protein